MPILFPRGCAAVALLAAAVGLAGCNRGKNAPAPPPPAVVAVAKPVAYPVQSYFEYNGYLDAVETVEIKARVKGFLTEVKFKEGEEVAAGTPLYRIDPREYEAALAKSVADIAKAKADIANAKAQITLGQAEKGRQEKAVGNVAGAQTELDKAIANLAASEAQLDVARANQAAAEAARDTAKLQLEYTDIRAPITGRISRTLVTRGNLVGQGDPTLLTTIVSVDPLYVYFDAPERDLIEYQRTARERNLPTATSRRIPVEVGVGTEDGFPHRGVIDFQENRVDVGTGTVRLRGVVPNPATGPAAGESPSRILYPGLYARVRVPSGPPETRPVIPEEALLSGQEGRYVYVIGPNNVVLKKVVTVGTRIYRAPAPGTDDGRRPWTLKKTPGAAGPPAGPPPGPAGPPPPPKTDLPVTAVVAIDSGLSADDVVIVDGLQKVRPGAPAEPEGWQFAGPPPKTGGPPLPPPPKAGGLPDTNDPKR